VCVCVCVCVCFNQKDIRGVNVPISNLYQMYTHVRSSLQSSGHINVYLFYN